MNAWLRARPWWQELLICWSVGSALMFLDDFIQPRPDSVLDPVIAGLVLASTVTGIGRWKRRYDRKEDADA
jgi:hypothetical protein